MAFPTTQPAKYDIGKQLLALLLSRPQNPAQQTDILAGSNDLRRLPGVPMPQPRPYIGAQTTPSPNPDILASGSDPRFYPATGQQAQASARPDILAGGYDPRRGIIPMPVPRPAGASQVDPEAYGYGGQPQSPVPLPIPRPQVLGMSARSQVPGSPMSLAPPGGAPTSMDFSGANGPQWNNQQYQDWWNRAQGGA